MDFFLEFVKVKNNRFITHFINNEFKIYLMYYKTFFKTMVTNKIISQYIIQTYCFV